MSVITDEKYYDKLSEDAIAFLVESKCSISKAVEKVARDNGCNINQAELIMAKTNHLVYKNAFMKDRTTVFEAGKISEVDLGPTVKVASVINTYEAKPMLEKFAAEDPESQQMPQQAQEAEPQMNQVGQEAIDNANQVDAAKAEQVSQEDELYNTIKGMIIQGDSPDEVRAFLVQTLGEEETQNVDAIMSQIVNQLHQEGVIDDEGEVVKTASLRPHTYNDKHVLAKIAKSLAETNRKIVMGEATHCVLMHKLASYGNDAYPMIKCAEDIMGDNWVAPGLYWSKQAAINGDMVGTGLATAGGILGLTAAIAGGNSLYDSYRRNKMRTSIRARYPELQDIPEDQFNDLFDSITHLSPSLMKAPYVLAESIKKHYNYGAFDPATAKLYTDIQANADRGYYGFQQNMAGAVPHAQMKLDVNSNRN